MTEDFEQLEKEMIQLAGEIAEVKKLSKNLEGEEKENFIKEIRTKQHQVMFYFSKVGNLSKQMRAKT